MVLKTAVNWAEESAARLAAERAAKMELQWTALTVVEKADRMVERRVARTVVSWALWLLVRMALSLAAR